MPQQGSDDGANPQHRNLTGGQRFNITAEANKKFNKLSKLVSNANHLIKREIETNIEAHKEHKMEAGLLREIQFETTQVETKLSILKNVIKILESHLASQTRILNSAVDFHSPSQKALHKFLSSAVFTRNEVIDRIKQYDALLNPLTIPSLNQANPEIYPNYLQYLHKTVFRVYFDEISTDMIPITIPELSLQPRLVQTIISGFIELCIGWKQRYKSAIIVGNEYNHSFLSISAKAIAQINLIKSNKVDNGASYIIPPADLEVLGSYSKNLSINKRISREFISASENLFYGLESTVNGLKLVCEDLEQTIQCDIDSLSKVIEECTSTNGLGYDFNLDGGGGGGDDDDDGDAPDDGGIGGGGDENNDQDGSATSSSGFERKQRVLFEINNRLVEGIDSRPANLIGGGGEGGNVVTNTLRDDGRNASGNADSILSPGSKPTQSGLIINRDKIITQNGNCSGFEFNKTLNKVDSVDGDNNAGYLFEQNQGRVRNRKYRPVESTQGDKYA
jgi:hypothetical protein